MVIGKAFQKVKRSNRAKKTLKDAVAKKPKRKIKNRQKMKSS